MTQLSTTKLSSKGQVVIPEEIRQKMGLTTGDQFVVVSEKDVVILKTIVKPSISAFNSLILKARSQAKKAGMTKQALKDAIKTARKK